MRDGTPRTKMNDATVRREEAVETKDKYVASGRADQLVPKRYQFP